MVSENEYLDSKKFPQTFCKFGSEKNLGAVLKAPRKFVAVRRINLHRVLNGNLKTSSWKLTTSSGIWVIEKRKRVVERNSLAVYVNQWTGGHCGRDHVNPSPTWWNASINMICIEKLYRPKLQVAAFIYSRCNTRLLRSVHMSLWSSNSRLNRSEIFLEYVRGCC